MTPGRAFSYLKLSVTLTLLLISTGTSLLFLNSNAFKDSETRLEDFRAAFIAKLNLSASILNRMESVYSPDMTDEWVLYTARKLGDTYQELHVGFYFFDKKGRQYWSCADLPFILLSENTLPNSGLLHVGSSYWYVTKKSNSKGVFGAAILLKHEYPDELGNEVFIPKDFEIGRKFDVLNSPSPEVYNLYESNGSYLFSIDTNGNSNYTYRPISPAAYAFLAISFVLFLLFLTFLAEVPQVESHYKFYLVFIAFLLFMLRYFGVVLSAFRNENLIMYYKAEGSPEAFFIPSLSGFFANTLIFLFFVHLICRPYYKEDKPGAGLTGVRHIITTAGFTFLTYLCFVLFVFSIRYITSHTSTFLDFSNLLKIHTADILMFVIFTSYLLSFIITGLTTSVLLSGSKYGWLFIPSTGILFLVLCILLPGIPAEFCLAVLVAAVVLAAMYFSYRFLRKYVVYNGIFVCLVLSVSFAYFMIDAQKERDTHIIRSYASSFAEELCEDSYSGEKQLRARSLELYNQLEAGKYIDNVSVAIYVNNKLKDYKGRFSFFNEFDSYGRSADKVGFQTYRDHVLYFQTDRQNRNWVLSIPKPGFSNYLQYSTAILVILLILFCSMFFERYYGVMNILREWGLLRIKIQLGLLFVFLLVSVYTIIVVISYIGSSEKELLHQAIQNNSDKIMLSMPPANQSIDWKDTSEVKQLETEVVKMSGILDQQLNIYNYKGELKIQAGGPVDRNRLLPPDILQMYSYGTPATGLIRSGDAIKDYSMYHKYGNDSGAYYLESRVIPGYHGLRFEENESLNNLVNRVTTGIALLLITLICIADRFLRPINSIYRDILQAQLNPEFTKMSYNISDELGMMADQYNRLLDYIDMNTKVLAQAERDTAWREMAKQVAHEIKNPLTPMKLNVQYLHKAWVDKLPNFDERLAKFKENMLDQIDTLSRIAAEFAHFAKLTTPMPEKIEIQTFIQRVIDFNKISDDDVNIEFYSKLEDNNSFVMADSDHLLRVLNNLIKNAVEAIPKNKLGRVEVSLYEKPAGLIIEVTDNGNGIPDKIREKIFDPNFTTKSSGTGLGLAICKSLVESMNGQITFLSKIGQGSSFFLTLPKIK
jgi:signal transduction histidine kinase